MADIWQIIVQSNTFNFLIVLAIVLFIVSKMDVKSKLDLIKDEIKSYVDSSVKENEDAKKALENINEKIKHLPEEIEDIKLSAQNNINGIEKRINEEIQEKMQDIENNAKRILGLETKKFKSRLSGILSQASIDLAKKNALEQLNDNRELHDKYIDEAIDEIDRISL